MSHFTPVEFNISTKYTDTVINALKQFFGDIQIHQTAVKMNSNYGTSYASQDTESKVNIIISRQQLEKKFGGSYLNDLGFNAQGDTIQIISDNFETNRIMPEIKTFLGQAVIQKVAQEKGFKIVSSEFNDGKTTIKLKKQQVRI